MSSALLQPAFSDPVLDAQRSFRAALKALANPGQPQALAPATLPAPLNGLHPATYALCLALLDVDTPLWLAPAFDTPAIRANLGFHCGCPIVAERPQARFALLNASGLDDLSGFDSGNDRYPDQSCTLLVQLPALDGGDVTLWRGPGIREQQAVMLPVAADFWRQRAARNAFPRGLDLLLIAGEQLLGLPRSTRVSAQEGN
ncbi:phosphonate C-P lyase system protein PhnH [Pseudomonas entomophila]|uniref:phosphonate C-P lyase system protein PhnH n=1 Tax=Pseudomonas entomophila TaxID=312306 RepID=UPI0023D894B4|nr:phosphonate C-P lyase system protein PhnH [Pseudomonas entomophila]MDF0729184.1 phosphonate C-P lyase system protein PhnH [Pseudomonas entomophila]